MAIRVGAIATVNSMKWVLNNSVLRSLLGKLYARCCNREVLTYGAIGIANTIVGYGLLFGLVFLGVIPELANAISYGSAFVLSYMLNKKFTFRSVYSHKRDFIRFACACGIAYCANLAVLIVCYRVLLWNEYISLIFSSAVYVVCGFLIHKFWTFR